MGRRGTCGDKLIQSIKKVSKFELEFLYIAASLLYGFICLYFSGRPEILCYQLAAWHVH